MMRSWCGSSFRSPSHSIGWRIRPNALFGEIWVLPGDESAEPLDMEKIDNYEHGANRDGEQAEKSKE